jgi:hypothetical protein
MSKPYMWIVEGRKAKGEYAKELQLQFSTQEDAEYAEDSLRKIDYYEEVESFPLFR